MLAIESLLHGSFRGVCGFLTGHLADTILDANLQSVQLPQPHLLGVDTGLEFTEFLCQNLPGTFEGLYLCFGVSLRGTKLVFEALAEGVQFGLDTLHARLAEVGEAFLLKTEDLGHVAVGRLGYLGGLPEPLQLGLGGLQELFRLRGLTHDAEHSLGWLHPLEEVLEAPEGLGEGLWCYRFNQCRHLSLRLPLRLECLLA